jgi:hypothetical protein
MLHSLIIAKLMKSQMSADPALNSSPDILMGAVSNEVQDESHGGVGINQPEKCSLNHVDDGMSL